MNSKNEDDRASQISDESIESSKVKLEALSEFPEAKGEERIGVDIVMQGESN